MESSYGAHTLHHQNMNPHVNTWHPQGLRGQAVSTRHSGARRWLSEATRPAACSLMKLDLVLYPAIKAGQWFNSQASLCGDKKQYSRPPLPVPLSMESGEIQQLQGQFSFWER